MGDTVHIEHEIGVAGGFAAADVGPGWCGRIWKAKGGMVRIGAVHYNTIDEIGRLGDALRVI